MKKKIIIDLILLHQYCYFPYFLKLKKMNEYVFNPRFFLLIPSVKTSQCDNQIALSIGNNQVCISVGDINTQNCLSNLIKFKIKN